MRTVAILLLGLAVANAAVFKEEEYQAMFSKFMEQYNKKYTADTFFYRYTVFKANMDKIALANKQQHSYKLGMNDMGDMTHAEFKKAKLGYNSIDRSFARGVNACATPKHAAPASVDWVAKGKVTPIKDQGQCGSCWAFATTESVESMWALATGDLPVLAPEQIVDCDTTDAGCNGGDTPSAFQYVTSAGGLDTEASYPYTAGQSGSGGSCQVDASNFAAKINGFTWAIPECSGSCDSQSMSQVQSKLATVGPFAICVYAEPWQDYAGGVFNDATCTHAYTDLDHCVQMVGYTPNYWIIRNSWAADWGEAGYIYVSSKVAKGNLCGVLDEVNFANADNSTARAF